MNKAVTFQATPNPSTMKFLLHKKVSDQGFDCPTAGDTERSPLAAKIFGFPWTGSVYIGTDFITVTKQDWVEWELLAHPLSNLIQDLISHREKLITMATQARTLAKPECTQQVVEICLKECL